MTTPKLASAAVLAAGTFAATPPEADAGVWFFSRSGRTGHFAAGVHGYGGQTEAAPRVDVREPAGPPLADRRPVWRETSTYEYYPPAAVRHGDHYDVLPGGYRYESTGSWE